MITVYRLWKDQTWDRTLVNVDPTILETKIPELIEAHACKQAWLQLLPNQQKPIQIGLLVSDPEVQKVIHG